LSHCKEQQSDILTQSGRERDWPFGAACSGASPTAPTAVTPTFSTTTFSSNERVSTTSERGSELPLKGTYEGLETVGTVSSHHHLDAAGNATQLGHFTVTASGAVTVIQTRGLSMPYNNSATFDGTIDLGH